MRKFIYILIFSFSTTHILCAQNWVGTNNYSTTTTYNVDGGITALSRNSTSNFDNLTYNFNDATHQLNHVGDAKTASVYGYDLADQATDNYTYDASGNLISNIQDALSITYNSFGKIEKITKASSETTTYTYDAAGNKIKKVNTSSSGDATTTYYFLDALGKEINIYESTSSSTEIKSLEASIDGYEQEGSIANNSTTASYTSSTNIYTRTLGNKSFYYKDHLGSIRTTYSDNTKTESDKNLVVASSENTFPYGMAQPLRSYNATNTRKGFQGKEAESTLASNKTVLDFGARYNDTRLGVWMCVDAMDAKFPSVSPYNSMGNSPINRIDPDGNADQPTDLLLGLKKDMIYFMEVNDLENNLNWTYDPQLRSLPNWVSDPNISGTCFNGNYTPWYNVMKEIDNIHFVFNRFSFKENIDQLHNNMAKVIKYGLNGAGGNFPKDCFTALEVLMIFGDENLLSKTTFYWNYQEISAEELYKNLELDKFISSAGPENISRAMDNLKLGGTVYNGMRSAGKYMFPKFKKMATLLPVIGIAYSLANPDPAYAGSMPQRALWAAYGEIQIPGIGLDLQTFTYLQRDFAQAASESNPGNYVKSLGGFSSPGISCERAKEIGVGVSIACPNE